MSHITALLRGMRPDGVEFRPLGNIFEMKAGKFIAANRISEFQDASFPYPCYGGNGVRGYVSEYNQEGKRLLIGRQGALCGNVKRFDGKFFATEHAVVCRSVADLDLDWAFHLLTAMHLNQYATRSAQPGLAVGTIEQVQAPLPPLKIQKRIAAVLDNFTNLGAELEAELRAELEARRLQYRYYRDAQLNHGEHASLGDIGTFTRGRRFTKDDYAPDGIGCIHYGDIYTRYGTSATETVSHVRADLAPSLRFAKTGDVVIAAVGETVEDVGKAVAWLGEDDVAVHDDCFTFHHRQNPRFISYCFQSAAFNAEKNKFVARAKVKRLSGESLAKLKIPVPPLDEQARIVSILDKFDAFVNDLSSALPAEVQARRQQYQHYRDRLMTFKMAA